MFNRSTSVKVAMMVLVAAGAATAQTPQDPMANAAAVYADWMAVMAEITDGVEVEERDIRNFLEHWRDLEALELGEFEQEDPAEFKRNFEAALADSRYRGWAMDRGLDPEGFVRRSLRITNLVMLRQSAAQEAMAEQQHAEQAAMVEEQCKQVDAATCGEMRDTVKALRAMGEAMSQAQQKLRPATAGEQALLERYSGELEAAMTVDEYDEYGDYEDYEDHEDYEDYED